MSRDDIRLTEIQIATLRALAEACDFSPNAHPPEQSIVRRFPTNLRGDASTALDQLSRMGLCRRHPTRGNTTWNINSEGLRLARQL